MIKEPIVYDDYKELVTNTVRRFNVADDDKDKILKYIDQLQEAMNFNSNNKFTKLTLVAGRPEHPIEWVNREGKIGEIIGPNMRNKTTTLIYIATLLGIDWEEVKPYLGDRESIKLLRQAYNVMDEISSGIPVECVK